MAASLVCKLIGVSDENIKLGLSETKVKGMFDLAILQAVKKYEDSI